MKPEEALQKSIIEWLAWTKPDVTYFHVPNGGDFPVNYKVKMRDMGVRPGVADLCFVLNDGKAAFIELKAPGNYLSPDQKDFRDEVRARGAWHQTARSLDEVEGILKEWGVT